MRSYNRKSTPRVKGGRVQKKNNWTELTNYYTTRLRFPLIDRKRPGPGYRHVLKQKDLHDFITILPDWSELSRGLNAVVLAPGEWDTDGYYHYSPGVVHICAWDEDLWVEYTLEGYERHRGIYERLGVPCEPHKDYVL